METRVITQILGNRYPFRYEPAEVTLVAEWPHGRLIRTDFGLYRFEPKNPDGSYSCVNGFTDDPLSIPPIYGYEVRDAMREDQERRHRAKYEPLLKRIENGAKPCFVRFGFPPKCGRSYDYREKRFEAGVAVYDAFIDREGIIIDLRGTDAASALFIIGTRDLYIVEGEVVGQTSDGTPALRVTRARRTNKPYKVLL